jgi:hypothetical protein
MEKHVNDVKNVRKSKTGVIVGVLIVLAIVLLFLGNFLYSKQNPGGTDFLVHWTGLRLFFQKGVSPYSDEAALAIQNAVYGHPAAPGQHELRVAYPLYSVLVFGPFLLIGNFVLARGAWMTLLELGVIATTYFSIRLFGWKPRRGIILGLLIFSLLWYHAIRTVVNGNVVILIGLGLVGVLLALKNGFDELAGVLLALSTIKPQVVLVFILFIFFWAITHKRGKIILWFFIALGILIALASLLIPDWIVQNLREIIRYTGYNPPGTLQTVFQSFWPSFGSRVGIALTVLVIAMLLVEWWLSRKGDNEHFIWTACLTLAGSQWVGIQSDAGNFVIMFPVIVLIFVIITERWKKRGSAIIWGSMIILLIGLWAIFLATLQHLDQPVQSPVMFLILPAILILLLYWVKWWVVKPPSVWYDEIASQQQR